VLHHLSDPDAGLRSLRAALKPEGAMHLMVYAPYGRTGVYMLQEYCHRLGVLASDKEIEDLFTVLKELPRGHPLDYLLRESPDFRHPGALADALLNPRERGLGMANIGGGLTAAMPGGGGTSQNAVNDQSGARSQLAEMVTAGVVLIKLLFLAPLISLMPEATLGALVLVAAASLVKLDEFRKIQAVRYPEVVWAVVAFFGVIVLGTLQG
jgi:hypothetical protein